MTTKWERLAPILRRGKWNFVHVVDAALESALSHSEKLVLIAIGTHCSAKNPTPSPGVRRLAALASVRAHTVMAAVDRLEKRGLIHIDRRHRQSHQYDLSRTMKALLAVAPIVTPPVSKQATAPVAPSDTAGAAGAETGCVDRGHPAVSIEDPNCVDRDNPRIQEGTNEGTSCASASDAPSFALESAPSRKRAAKRVPKLPKKTKPVDPEQGAKHKRVTDCYFERFETKRGTKPPFDGAEGTAVKKLLKKLAGDDDRACMAINGAFADDWWSQRVTIRDIASNPAKFLNLKPRKANGRTPTQPNHSVALDAEEYA